MKQKTLLPRRIISAALSLALVLPASLALLGFAEAKESLPHVEEIKKSKTEFNILEIVPAVGQGEIGYYIPGQEPWDAALAAITTPDARQKKFNDIARGLVADGIIGELNTTTSPLTRTNDKELYQEAYPWSNEGAGPGEGFTEFTLDQFVTEKLYSTVGSPSNYTLDYSTQDDVNTYVGKDKGKNGFIPWYYKKTTFRTKIVFRKLACTNNDWFLKYAFDWDKNETKPKLLVNSKPATEVTAEDIRDCDLLVLSNGYAPGGTVTKYTKDNDISSAVSTAILAAVQKTTGADWDYGLPIVVDSRIASNSTGATNLKAVANTLRDNKTDSFVKDSVFYFTKDNDRAALVTMNFNKHYPTNTYEKENSPFYEVYKTAEAANVGREPIDQISTEVSLGTIFRHLVGLAALRDARLRRELHVLDIEPGDTTALNAETVAGWTGFKADKITITTMSTSEFIGKIEDVSEVYDMVYIGDTPEADTKRAGWLDNGFLYANIGKEREIMGEARGLTDAEYWNSGVLDTFGGGYHILKAPAPKTRYSGNDLTPAKRTELENFAKAGNPVVVANGIAEEGTEKLPEVPFKAEITWVADPPNRITLKATPTASSAEPIPENMTATYQWYQRNPLDKNPKFEAIVGATVADYVAIKPATGIFWFDYLCVVSYQVDDITYSATSKFINVDISNNTVNVTDTPKDSVPTPGIIPVRPAKKYTVNTDTVDDCSYMYELLDSIKGIENVQWAGKVNLLALSKTLRQPKLNLHLTESPTPYAMNDSGTVTSLKPDAPGGNSYSLNFKFCIAAGGNADAKTLYTCSLLLDNDADGRYMEGAEKNEAVTGLQIRDNGKSVMNTELEAGVEYTAKYIIPNDLKGLVSWKLKLSQTGKGNELFHDSAHGYTHVPVGEKDRKEIRVLQINTGRTANQKYGAGDNPKGGLSLQTGAGQESGSRQTFKDLFAKVQDFKIGIQTITTKDANEINAPGIYNNFDKKHYSKIGEFLASYDMLIIGIDECYNELSKETADAIVAALKGGQPVMYTHDTTSLANVPEIYMSNPLSNYWLSTKPEFYYGYYFNNILRDAVGLDRYGVTTEKYGGTRMSNPSLKQSGIVAANYIGITEQQKKDILADKYSLAYVPGSSKNTLSGATQGFTNYSARNWKADDNRYTSHASQVNEGQITCYPFDVNTQDFGGKLFSTVLGETDSNAIDILKTHQQYYQTNMNADDIVVWYCLKEDEKVIVEIPPSEYKPPKYAQNDVANAYYIYTQGNAIYTGFGHTTEGIGDAEAKLFINAMIAAYKSAQISAGVRFTDSTGVKDMESFIVPADGETILRPTGAEIGDDRKLYFTTSGAAATASFSYGENATPITGLPVVYKVEGDVKQDLTGTLTPGAYYVKLDELLSAINKDADKVDKLIGTSGLKITIAVSAGGKSATDVLTLRKIMLFPLN